MSLEGLEVNTIEFDNVLKLIKAFKPEILPKMVGHRGFHSRMDLLTRPLENTIRAFETCWKNGMQLCECDITHSSDGHVVLAHDETYQRLSGKSDELHTSKIEKLTMQQLSTILFRDGSKVLTLPEVFSVLKKYPNGRLVIEIKRTAHLEVITKRVVELIDEFDIWDQVPIIMSFSQEIMYETRRVLGTKRHLRNNAGFQMDSSQSVISIEEAVGSDGEGSIKGELLESSGTQFMVLTQFSKGWECTDQELKDGSFCFNLKSPDVVNTIEDKLLTSGDVMLDGVYMGFQDEMINDNEVVENLKHMCKRFSVGIFFEKQQPDKFSIVKKLLDMGVKFVNTDLPPYEEFFDIEDN